MRELFEMILKHPWNALLLNCIFNLFIQGLIQIIRKGR